MIYEPREDSELLKKWVSVLAEGKVLDMGTGSGIQAITAARRAGKVVAVDINKEALEELEKKRIDNIETKESDLFKSIYGKFDVIIFNPPYLPQDEGVEDEAVYGGKHGYEVLERFLRQAKNYLEDGGFILFLFSSLTNKSKVESVLEEKGYTWSKLDEQKMDFESIYVYKAWQ